MQLFINPTARHFFWLRMQSPEVRGLAGSGNV
jgi:hypothetical protein